MAALKESYLLSSPGVLYRPSASGPSAKPSSMSFNHSRERCSRSSVLQPESVRREKSTTPSSSSASTMDRSERYASRAKWRKSAASYTTSYHQAMFLNPSPLSPRFWVQMTPGFVVQSCQTGRVSHEPLCCVWVTALVSVQPFLPPSEKRNWPSAQETPWSWKTETTFKLNVLW